MINAHLIDEDIFTGIRSLVLTKEALNSFIVQDLRDNFIYNQIIVYIINSAGETITYPEAAKLLDEAWKKRGDDVNMTKGGEKND